ncbi:Twin-arginine translocation pathway signal [Delftia sp. 670]|uniref:tripartite tricarboxylate transporter substrate binding protein n=1 Tax=Delftia TaxID=80865 RepID=UPI0004D8EC39|nr:tripartite tricarboxylate transporter substrate binding protein [Delftia lacustris]KEH11864.1 Twin-arginine translocation pathway signal [Delftia sp. 670]
MRNFVGRRQFLKTSGLGVLGLPVAGAIASTESVPLKLIVPFTPGTGIDTIARTIGPLLAKRQGRSVVVENKPGASGNIGTEAVVRSPANGQTLLVTVNTLVMNASLYPKLPFNPLTDLEPVTLTSWGQLILVTPTASAYQTAADLVKAAKASPGRINYASPGVGTPHHMAMELFKSTAGVSITHIPYRGTGPALTDLLGGQVECMFLPIHVALTHVKAGKLRALGIGSQRRHPLLPDVPTLKEAKAGDVNVDMWYGVFAPAGMPADQVDALNREIRAILASEEVRHAFAPQGMDPAGSTPAEFKALVQKDARRWADLVKARGITAE